MQGTISRQRAALEPEEGKDEVDVSALYVGVHNTRIHTLAPSVGIANVLWQRVRALKGLGAAPEITLPGSVITPTAGYLSFGPIEKR